MTIQTHRWQIRTYHTSHHTLSPNRSQHTSLFPHTAIQTPQWQSTDPFQSLKSPRQSPAIPSVQWQILSVTSDSPFSHSLSVTYPPIESFPTICLSVCLIYIFLISTFRFSVQPQIPFWLQIIFQFPVFSLIKFTVHDRRFNYMVFGIIKYTPIRARPVSYTDTNRHILHQPHPRNLLYISTTTTLHQ